MTLAEVFDFCLFVLTYLKLSSLLYKMWLKTCFLAYFKCDPVRFCSGNNLESYKMTFTFLEVCNNLFIQKSEGVGQMTPEIPSPLQF